MAGRYLLSALVSNTSHAGLGVTTTAAQGRFLRRRKHSRLDGVRNGVQQILELARLRPQLVQRARVVPGVVAPPSIAEGALVAQMVASGAAYLRHGLDAGGGVNVGVVGSGGLGSPKLFNRVKDTWPNFECSRDYVSH